MKSKIKNVLIFILLFISSILIVGTLYYKANFAEQTFETLLYNVGNGVKNANTEIVGIAIKQCIWKISIVLIIIYLPLFIKFKYKKKDFQLLICKKMVYAIIIFIMSVLFLFIELGLFEYIDNQINTTLFFEKNYIPNDIASLTFPEKKRNLIFIFLESMETSLISEENGGGWDYTVISELEQLAKENINFSNTNKLGGAVSVNNTTWTVAGMIAQTSGTPLKMNIGSKAYAKSSSFLPGVYSLGDILEKEGYNLEVMFGSDSSYGGRKEYFQTHGKYKVFDLNTAIEEGKMTEDDKVWWGFDDDDLFAWAKEEILKLSKEDKPFNFTMLTADTHFYNGYLSENVEDIFEDRYENIFAYSSKKTYEFVKWIQDQDFYDNTTIVIVGDHLGMQTEFYNKHISNKNYPRTVYNVFINSVIEEKNSKNRSFSTLDIFPTVLASMGVEVEGNRMGLGTNLFSGEKTLLEKMEYDALNKELSKRSNYYNNVLLQGDYYESMNKDK